MRSGVKLLLLFRKGGVYLLQDEFTTNLAAGSVNGTAAEPGPGARTITADTGGKISIAGGRFVMASNTTTADPQAVFTPTTRAFGRFMLAELTAGASSYLMIGFRLNTSVNNTAENAFYVTNTTQLQIRESATAFAIGHVITAGVTTRIAIVARTSGAFYLVKGNGFTYWTLVWLSTSMNGATLYPMLIHVSGANAHSSDYVRVPSALFFITPLASDGFGGAFGLTDGLGHQETSGPGSGGNNVAWTHNTYSTSGGKAINTPGKGAELLTNTTFDSNTTGWTAVNATLSSVAGGQSNNALQVLSTSATASSAYAYQGGITVAGDWVLAVIWHKNGTQSGSMRLASTSSGSDIKSLTVQSDGSWTQKLLSGRALGANTYLRLSVGAGGTNDTTLYDEVSLKKLNFVDLFASVSVTAADVILSADLVVPNGLDGGFVLGLDSASAPANLVIVHVDRLAGNCVMTKYVAGVPTQIFSAAITYSSGAPLRVTKITSAGTATIRVYYNNTYLGNGTVTDVGIISNVKHGLFITDPTVTFDNFTNYASGTGGEYAAMDNY